MVKAPEQGSPDPDQIFIEQLLGPLLLGQNLRTEFCEEVLNLAGVINKDQVFEKLTDSEIKAKVRAAAFIFNDRMNNPDKRKALIERYKTS